MTDTYFMNNNSQMQTPTLTNAKTLTPALLEHGEVAYEKINENGTSPLLLVCEHASRHIPKYFNGLGLGEDVKKSHVAWDPGALDLAKCLSEAFDATLIKSNISRLVYDCNRPQNDASAMPKRSEIFDIPGNADISDSEILTRTEQIYNPFYTALGQTIAKKQSNDNISSLVTIHSFTPVYFGEKRDVEIGILHSSDSRLADEMLLVAPELSDLQIERNQPYGPEDGVAHTLEAHGLKNNLANVMIEVRNDLLANQAGVKKICGLLVSMISRAEAKILSSSNEGNK